MFKEIFDRIEKADVITIFGHVFPDGDCYGSNISIKIKKFMLSALIFITFLLTILALIKSMMKRLKTV